MPLNLENTPSCSSQTAGDCGIKTLDYYLKQNRAMAIPSGASPEEKQHLHLQEKCNTDTSASVALVPAQTASETIIHTEFEQLKVTLKTIGLSK
ncbi:hypothetical protein SCLCIDRAFT_33182 [Scleroderma citrinum Foug A]|uniref:Uncharacterized protein n=1 Tax=Scleroderma citrinum Foug A TaxID=1036808 RepID=A0A0C3D5V4_9AGAM|nr:hypothetical protein SCLCIDRAFT_33182 [Scleroderma citrinum Foug A]